MLAPEPPPAGDAALVAGASVGAAWVAAVVGAAVAATDGAAGEALQAPSTVAARPTASSAAPRRLWNPGRVARASAISTRASSSPRRPACVTPAGRGGGAAVGVPGAKARGHRPRAP